MFHNRRMFLHRKDDVLLIFSLMLSGSIAVAVGGLLVWHTFLIVTGQGTIDFIENFQAWNEARKAGRPWRNPYDQGWIKNFKVKQTDLFDEENVCQSKHSMSKEDGGGFCG